ncbi:MAG: hypothetical protein ACKOCM_04405 [Cyanobacteriota bacterium]
MKMLIPALSSFVFIAACIIPAQAEIPGHVYVYTDMEMQLYEPAQKIKVRDGEVTCNTYGYGYLAQTNCTTSEPVYIERPARSYSRILRVTIDCTDETSAVPLVKQRHAAGNGLEALPPHAEGLG